MKKIIAVFLILLISSSAFCDDDVSSIYFGLDLGYLDPLLNKTVYNQIETKMSVAPGLEFSIPVNYVIPTEKNKDATSLGAALNLNYRPFENGLFFSFSMFDISYVFGSDAPSTRLNYLNQMGLGYTFGVKKFQIEPAIIFINPNGVYDVTINQLKESLGGYPTIRLQFIVSYRIFEIKNY
jgi:hypothetical protein